MQAKELLKILHDNQELSVRIAESKKHNDNAPIMGIIDAEKVTLENSEDEIILLWSEPNPNTISKD